MFNICFTLWIWYYSFDFDMDTRFKYIQVNALWLVVINDLFDSVFQNIRLIKIFLIDHCRRSAEASHFEERNKHFVLARYNILNYWNRLRLHNAVILRKIVYGFCPFCKIVLWRNYQILTCLIMWIPYLYFGIRYVLESLH